MFRSSHFIYKNLNRILSRCKRSHRSTHVVRSRSFATPAGLPERVQKSGAGPGLIVLKVLGYGVVAYSAAGIAVGGYAFYDKEFRAKLENNLIYSKEVLEFVEDMWSKNGPKLADSKRQGYEKESRTEKAKDAFGKLTTAVTSISRHEPVEDKPRKAEKKTEDIVEKRREDISSENEALEDLVRTQTDQVECVVKEAIDLHMAALSSIKEHTDHLRKALDDSVDIMSKDDQWQDVIDAYAKRSKKGSQAERAHNMAKDTVEKLKRILDEGKSNPATQSNSCLGKAKATLNQSQKALAKAAYDVTKAESEAQMLLTSHEMVEKARKQFREELEMITPDTVATKDNTEQRLTEDQLNTLILHAYRRIAQLQKQLSKQISLERAHLQDALDQQQKSNEILNAEHTKQLLDAQLADFERKQEKLRADSTIGFERQLIDQLTRQGVAYSEHLKDMLERQRVELEKDTSSRLNETVIKERRSFQSELNARLARLQGLEAAIDEHANRDRVTKSAHDLWLSSVALATAVDEGNAEVWCRFCWETQVKPLADEISAVRSAGYGHPFVDTVIRSIPREVEKAGVWPGKSLEKRFAKVRRTCGRVAHIDDSNTRSLPKYWISWLYSIMHIPTVEPTSPDSLVNPSALDNLECLAHAQYWINQGNLEYAVRFMNLLHGESRMVADDWIRETTWFLETHQAVQLIASYASATAQANQK